MLIFFLSLIGMYLLFLPVTLHLELHHHSRTHAALSVTFLWLTKTWRRDSLTAAADGMRQSRIKLLLQVLLRSDKARHFLLRHTCLEALDVLILLRTGDAARSALLTGSLQSLAALPVVRKRNMRIRVLPEFFRPHSTVAARCIIRLRLGTIILTMTMLLLAYFRQQRVQKARNAYGTSHW